MTKSLEEQFHDEMIGLHHELGRSTGYWANRYLQKVKRDGGLKAARYYLAPKKGITSGLERLSKEKRLDLSLEYVVLLQKWRELFSNSELKVAEDRLAKIK